jgi:hypothetical protein
MVGCNRSFQEPGARIKPVMIANSGAGDTGTSKAERAKPDLQAPVNRSQSSRPAGFHLCARTGYFSVSEPFVPIHVQLRHQTMKFGVIYVIFRTG